MKNGVEFYKDFFPYFKALKTNCEGEMAKKRYGLVRYTLRVLFLLKVLLSNTM